MNRIALTGADLFAWMALRRVRRGYIAKLGDRYFDAGRPIPGYLAEALDALTGAGLVVPGHGRPAGRWAASGHDDRPREIKVCSSP